jgi:hypothetical protein
MSPQSRAAYLAGFMDGEGSFSIVKTHQITKRKDGTKHKGVRYHLHIKIANTNLAVLKWIVEHFGGQISKKKDWSPKWKPRYDWTLTGYGRMEAVILSILPYLQIKREQSLVALEFARLNGQEVPEKRNELRNKMLILNDSKQPHSESLTTNTQDTENDSVKIESELIGDYESALGVTQAA